jgi:hypothetical protein
VEAEKEVGDGADKTVTTQARQTMNMPSPRRRLSKSLEKPPRQRNRVPSPAETAAATTKGWMAVNSMASRATATGASIIRPSATRMRPRALPMMAVFIG